MKHFHFILNILISSFSFSQVPPISNQMALGGSENESVSTFLRAPDNSGYFIIGTSTSNISGTKSENSRGMEDIWIQKVDNDLNLIWDKTYGGNDWDVSWNGKIFDDKLYVFSHSSSPISGDKTMSSFGMTDIWLLCTDLSGDLLWQTQYGGSLDEIYPDFVEYTDTSILVSCQSNSPISGNKSVDNFLYDDIWLFEISKQNGTIIQQKNIGSDGFDNKPVLYKSEYNSNYFIVCTSDGSASGDKTEDSYGGADIWFIEIDQDLNIVQDKILGGNQMENLGRNVIVMDGEHIYLSASSSSRISGNKTVDNFYTDPFVSNDAWLLKLDYDLNIIWDKAYGGSSEDFISHISKLNYGNMALGIVSRSNPGTGNKTSPRINTLDLTFDAWMLIINGNGDIIVQETYGGDSDDAANFIQTENNSELILYGESSSGISGNKTVASYGGSDIWLAKIDATEFLSISSLVIDNESINVYPNPYTETVTFDFEDLNEDITIYFYSVDGKLLDEISVSKETKQFIWTPFKSESMIIYKIVGDNFNVNGKLIKN